MKSVCFVVQSVYDIDPRVRRKAEALVAAGYSTDVLSLRPPNGKKTYTLNGVNVRTISLGKARGSQFRYAFEYITFFMWAFLRAPWQMLSRHYEVIDVNSLPDFLVFALILAGWMGAKLVLDLHEIMPECYMSKYLIPENRRSVRLLKYLEKRSIDFADRVITIHDPIEDLLVGRGLPRSKSTVVMNAADEVRFVGNSGSGPGTVNSISISGSAFVLQGKPLLPATVPAGQTLGVTLLYKPTAISTDTGQLTIIFASGDPVTINLAGSGTAASFTYQLLNSNPPTSVSPGATISLPSANPGQTTSVSVRVLNSGTANGVVNSISVVGQGFQLGNVLPPLPETLAPGASGTFTVNFTPTQPGTLSGTLIVNSDIFSLSGVGLGPLLTFSYVVGGTTITLGGTNNTVVFSPVQITQSGQVNLDVKNTGTLPAIISNIGIQQTGSPYTISGQPPLSVTLAPNADFQLTIKFTPTTLGFSNANLLFDTTSIALEGQGTAPPPLPSYTISGPSGNALPMTQPTVAIPNGHRGEFAGRCGPFRSAAA